MARREQGVKSRTTKDGRTLWDAYWSVDGTKPMRRGLATAKEAARVRREALAAADRGEHVAASLETLGMYLERWAASKDATTRGRLTRHVIPSLGKVALQKLRAEDVEAHYAFLMEGEELGANTVRLIHGALKAAMNDAEERRRVVVNVMRHVKPPRKQDSNVPDPWSIDEVKRLMAAAENDRFVALWRLYADTGARRNEPLGLRWSDVDLEGKTVSFHRAVKTKASRRRVDLADETVAALRSWTRRQAEELLAVGIQGVELVFTLEDGSPVTSRRVNRSLIRLKEAAGITRRLRLHDLRHAWATHAIANGVPVKVVSERLGHAMVMITVQMYQHGLPGMQADAAARVASLYS